jgi:DNA-nicking Smr family endonuclease
MVSKRLIPIPADETSLLREALKDVSPLPDRGRVRHALPRAKPIARQRILDEQRALRESLLAEISDENGPDTGEELSFLREGLASDVLRKLRRGRWVIQDHLDLHGANTEQARALVVTFLNQNLLRGHRCVRIVHGKGLGSKNREPVLKKNVGKWLAQRQEILAYCQAKQVDGGSGALLVLLKSPNR